jgi:transposase InsO family protein
LYKKLKNKRPLNKSKKKLTSYTGHKLHVVGETEACVLGKMIPFYVVKPTRNINPSPLLGFKASTDLQIIKVLVASVKLDSENVDKEFPNLFGALGCLGEPYKIKLDSSVEPTIDGMRKIPFALRNKVKETLDHMEDIGVIEKQEGPTEWVSSMVVVEKSDGSLRICLDPANLNKAVMREHYPMPNLEEIASNLEGAKFFTKLDAESSFWQIPLDEESSKLCCMNTPFGRYIFKRLPMGLKSASEVFHKRLKQIFSHIPHTDNWIDDILVWGKTREEHDRALNEVLTAAKNNNLTLKKKKCEFAKSEIKYVGHIFNQEGMKSDPEKVEAIQKMPTPKSKKELQRFLGMVNYLGKFVKNMADITAPLRILLKKDVEWQWNVEQENAFLNLKAQLTDTPVLVHFNAEKPVTITADSSSVGLGCALLQEGKPVSYASRSLTSTEQKYAQIEKETLAIVFACEKFHQYIYGRPVEVESDHKPLQNIWKKPLNSCPPRIQRFRLRLQKYDLNIIYKPGKDMHIADTLSRAALPCTSNMEEEVEDVRIHVNMIKQNLSIAENKREEIRNATEKECKDLKKLILEGWPAHKHQVPSTLRQYFQFNEELSIVDDMIFKANKVFVPPSMRNEMIERIHEGHLGMVKCKNRARQLLFWPGMNLDIERAVARCAHCLKYRNKQQKEPLKPHDIPEKPWQKVATDLFHWNNHDYLLVADYYSKFVEICVLENTKSKTVINHMKSIFARQSPPEEVVSDNGPQYSSVEFKQFAETWEFQHTTSSPGYPRSNGFAERMVQTVKKLLSKARDSGQDVYLALLNWRATPISSTISLSPAELLNGRRYKTRLNVAANTGKTISKRKSVERALKKSQEKQKAIYDKHTKALPTLNEQDKHVYMRDGHWKPVKVVGKADAPRSYLVQTGTNVLRRNRSELMKINDKYTDKNSVVTSESDQRQNGKDNDLVNVTEPSTETVEPTSLSVQSPARSVNRDQHNQQDSTSVDIPPLGKTRCGRVVNKPKRLIDYVTD